VKIIHGRKWRIILGLGVLVLTLLVVLGLALLITTKNTPSPTSLSVAEQQGKALFITNCNSCHGGEGRQSNLFAPALSTSNSDEATARNYIKNGKGSMPGFGTLSNPELDNLAAYLKAIRSAAN
jgi:mono/diheme cytochrome c family protein